MDIYRMKHHTGKEKLEIYEKKPMERLVHK